MKSIAVRSYAGRHIYTQFSFLVGRLSASIVAMLAAISPAIKPAQAEFVLIDDFESYTLGAIDGQSDGSGTWVANPILQVVAEPGAPNQVLDVQSSAPETNSYYDDPNVVLPEGDSGTLFFRINRATDVVGHIVWGLSDVATPGAWGDYEASVGDRSQQTGGPGDLQVRGGGAYITLEPQVAHEEWINIWVLIDNAQDTQQVYAQSETTFPTQTLLDDDSGTTTFDFRNGTASDLTTFLLRTGTTHSGPYFIDDIYMDAAGFNLASPIGDGPMVTPGDFNDDGNIDMADFQIMLDNFNEQFTITEARTRGDMNFNGAVDLHDFGQFRAAFHAQGAAVPEPGALGLAAIGVLALIGVARRRR